MNRNMFKPFVLLGVIVSIVSLACSLAKPSNAVPTSQATNNGKAVPTLAPINPPSSPTSAPSSQATALPNTGNGSATNIQDVQKAVIQIEAQGNFVDPKNGEVIETGRGSGFIIDPSGIAVTNNHVVTGAATITVWVGGDQSKSYNARVLGVSECSDLAVIKIDGDNFPTLNFYKGPIQVAMDVYSAGFPLGDPHYTLTKGIISKAQANGESQWASVGSVIEHTATINPGNSGGPLLNTDGQVVGINYASLASANQYFAINAQGQMNTINQLMSGKSVDTIGVNGRAFETQDQSFYGVWVSSIQPGSPADKAGIQPGDIITQLQGLPVGQGALMTDYCKVLRSHSPSDTISLQVIRLNTNEVLSGELNGRELQVTGQLQNGNGQGNQGGTPSGNQGGQSGQNGYTTVRDNSNTIEVSVPSAWNQVDGSPWQSNGQNIGVSITASPDVQKFNNSWGEPGVFFGASDKLAQLGGYIQVLDATRDSYNQSCKYKERKDYNDNLYKGAYDLYDNCGGQGGPGLMVLSLVPNDNSQAYEILVVIPLITQDDLNALSSILQSFKVIGNF